jgi:hypothetical protein
MQEVSTTATLVEPAALEGGIEAVLSRQEIEEALEADDESFALWFDLSSGDDQARLQIELPPEDAERLLRSSSGGEVRVAIGGSGLADLFSDPDVEAHGLREKAVLIGIVAVGAAAGASQADARPILDVGAGASAPVGAVAAAGDQSPAEVQGGAAASSAIPDAVDRAVAAQASGGAELTGAVAASGGAAPAAVTGAADVVDRAVAAQPNPDAIDRAVTAQASGAEIGGAVAAAGGEAPAAVTGGATGEVIGGAVAAAGSESPAQATGGAVVTPELSGAVAAAGGDSPAESTGGAGPEPIAAGSDGSGFEISMPSPGEGALIGGLALLLTGAGVVAARGGSRRRPAT